MNMNTMKKRLMTWLCALGFAVSFGSLTIANSNDEPFEMIAKKVLSTLQKDHPELYDQAGMILTKIQNYLSQLSDRKLPEKQPSEPMKGMNESLVRDFDELIAKVEREVQHGHHDHKKLTKLLVTLKDLKVKLNEVFTLLIAFITNPKNSIDFSDSLALGLQLEPKKHLLPRRLREMPITQLKDIIEALRRQEINMRGKGA